ncbi:hypothetical protein AAHE18_13G126800 [Arachis hypogaea]
MAWTAAELEPRRVVCHGTGAEEGGVRGTGAEEGGAQRNWSRGRWSAAELEQRRWSVAELEQRRAGARWNRAGAAEQRIRDGGTMRHNLQCGRRLRAVAETTVVGTAVAGRRK